MNRNIELIIPSIPKVKSNLSSENFNYMRELIFQLSGIILNDDKIQMVENRILRRSKNLGLSSIDEYVSYLKKNKSEITPFINSLTTNKTEFFREKPHFDYLEKKFLKNLLQHKKSGKTIYAWSAACSRGHEVYTLAMCLNEFLKSNPGLDFKILGTDIDTDVLATAQKGEYPREIVMEQVPPQLSMNYFNSCRNNTGMMSFSNELKEKIKFRRFNLVDSLDILDMKFEIVFLRNVMIYFPSEVIQVVIDKISKMMMPGAILFIGHSETLAKINHDFQVLNSSTYIKK